MNCPGNMSRRTRLVVSLFALLVTVFASAAPAEIVTATLPVTVRVFSRTSLKVTSEVLRFDVGAADAEASVAVDFTAAARTARDGELVLSVEPLGTAGVEAGEAEPITFVGQGEGTRSGALRPDGSSVAARWTGSGRRTGSLIFSLRATVPGSYVVPVRFVLSTP